MSAAVTHPQKRYARIFVCVACDSMDATYRAHTLTCSPACRVRMHRDPSRIKALKAQAAAVRIPVALILDAQAIHRLRPDLGERVRQGEIEIEDTREEMHRTFYNLVFRLSDEARQGGAA